MPSAASPHHTRPTVLLLARAWRSLVDAAHAGDKGRIRRRHAAVALWREASKRARLDVAAALHRWARAAARDSARLELAATSAAGVDRHARAVLRNALFWLTFFGKWTLLDCISVVVSISDGTTTSSGTLSAAFRYLSDNCLSLCVALNGTTVVTTVGECEVICTDVQAVAALGILPRRHNAQIWKK